ncbi:DUF6252 family protein [Pedobacter rhizosphaerae]|uniref:Uncharacterized protein n=1 Tax=Pedobacter rhizosphaerae TaxID=390241 RepID=A0A1H9Q3E2_9SPHI|nr:DUF6252 family protein [Pedobacter rhizosphaerae]SER54902.1 hypothetical protein SAMN04488023_11116 [Pedobacter rhizosphaerae]
MAFLCLLFTTSCNKKIDYHPEWDVSIMSGKVDGVLLQCSSASAQTFVVGAKKTLQIIGNKGSSGFSIMIDDFKGAGTYNLSDQNLATYLLGTSGLQDAYLSSSSGSVKITSYTEKQIKGVFEFKGQNIVSLNTKNITEGQFTINLVPVKIPETNSGTNNLSAKIDGVTTGFTGEGISTASPVGNLLSIVTANGEKRIILSVIGYKGAGTYDLANDGTGAYMKDQTATGSFSAETGTLVVSSDAGGKIKGTFSFKAPNEDYRIQTTVNVTDGTFDLPFSKK